MSSGATVVNVPPGESSAVLTSAPIQEQMVDMQISFIAIDGTPARVHVDSGDMDDARKMMCLASCCPCFVGGIRSPERVAELKNMLKRVTFWIVIAQLIMFIVSLGCSGGFASIKENPLLGPSTLGLVKSGAQYTYAILHGGVHRLLVPVLLHANLFHLALNIWAELVICMYAEYTLQIVRFCIIFVVSGLGSTLLSTVVSPTSISVGASGAVMGVMSVLLINALFEKEKTDPLRLSMIRSLSISIIVMLFLGFAPHVDFASHLGGFIVGSLIGLYYWGAHGIKSLARVPKLQKAFPFIMAGLLAIYFLVVIIVLAVATEAIPLFGEESSASSDLA